MSRDNILHKVRTALSRSAGQPPAAPPEVRLRIPELDLETRLASFSQALEALGGQFYRAASIDDARDYVERLVAGKTAVASNSQYLSDCGISSLPGVWTGVGEEPELRRLCATADFGISGAAFGLADTGSLVMLSSEEARMISLVPPAHIAVFPKERMLTGLDELFTRVPRPADGSSSMVLITGPSRTADIEQILIRGVHGPGAIYVVVV